MGAVKLGLKGAHSCDSKNDRFSLLPNTLTGTHVLGCERILSCFEFLITYISCSPNFSPHVILYFWLEVF